MNNQLFHINTIRRTYYSFLALILFGHAWLLYKAGFSWNTTLTESLLNTLTLGGSGFILFQVFRHYLPPREKFWSVLLVIHILTGITTLVQAILLNIFLQRYPGMETHFAETIVPRICFTLLWNSLVAFLSMAIKASRDNSQQAQRVRDVEQFAKDAELFRLRQQLQPHFLYNSLNSINALIGIQPEKAREMVGQLSDFLRSTVKVDDSQLSTLKEELEQLNLYLNIEKVRFGHRLQAGIAAEGATVEAKLPALILQPLVENAIKYGLYDTLETVDITIEATLNEKQLVVSVCNPYDPVTASAHKGTGFGLNGIRKRLYLLYGRNDLLTTTSENGRFCATVQIPQLHVQSDNN